MLLRGENQSFPKRGLQSTRSLGPKARKLPPSESTLEAETCTFLLTKSTVWCVCMSLYVVKTRSSSGPACKSISAGYVPNWLSMPWPPLLQARLHRYQVEWGFPKSPLRAVETKDRAGKVRGGGTGAYSRCSFGSCPCLWPTLGPHQVDRPGKGLGPGWKGV